jgi:hypothetical protein
MQVSRKVVLSGCVLFVLAVALGCGKTTPRMESGRGAVTGTITIDGKPLPGGTIFFVSAKDPQMLVSSTIKSDGTFSVADAPKGDVLVAVDNESQKGNNPKNYIPLPGKYRNAKTSGLTANIAADQPVKIELKSK